MNENHKQRIETANHTLIGMLKDLMPEPVALKTSIKGLTVARRDCPTKVTKCFYKPVIVSTLQGKKHSVLGSEKIIYGKNQSIVTTIDIPVTSKIIEASSENPYYAIMIELDCLLILELLKNVPLSRNEAPSQRSMAVTSTDCYILEDYIRLIELLKKPEEEQKMLSSMILREIHYRLLNGHLGNHLRSIYEKGSKNNQISKAVGWIKDNFKNSFKIEDLAELVNMSASSFYRNFNKVTSLSPIQYQKYLRLHEAQHLMLMGKDATNAAYLVGYESPTQFNREYKRLFGNPPRLDVKAKHIS